MQLGELDIILPVVIGNPKGTCTADPLTPAPEYENWNWGNDFPRAPDTHVQQVEEKLVHNMEDYMSLGLPRETKKTVEDVLNGIVANSGFMVRGEGVEAFKDVTDRISDFIAL